MRVGLAGAMASEGQQPQGQHVSAFQSIRHCVAVNTEANARRMALVESCFGSAGQPLSIPGRVLVGEGVLTKSCRKKLKPRQFFLFNDLLVYGNIIINKKKYNKQHIIPLEQVGANNALFVPWVQHQCCFR
jgi:hypothetical protein